MDETAEPTPTLASPITYQQDVATKVAVAAERAQSAPGLQGEPEPVAPQESHLQRQGTNHETINKK